MSKCCGTTLVRGDSYTLSVGLGSGWEETVADADLFRGGLYFREIQDDAAPTLLKLTAALKPNEDTRYPGIIGLFHFEASIEQTQALPPYDIVCFCEIFGTDGLYVRRLFECDVEVID